jgi:hypothetical protein
MSSVKRLHALLGLFAILSTVVLGPATAASAASDPPPANRRNFVVALMRNDGTRSTVRIAQYSLRADQSIRADYWAWSAVTPKPRTATPYTTSGCAHVCRVYTAAGFQKAASSVFGTWSITAKTLTVTWRGGLGAERWTIANYATASRIKLASHPTATDGFGWGSTVGFTTGVNTTTIFNLHGWYEGPRVINNYGQVTRGTEALVIHPNDAAFPHRRCNANCIDNSTVTNKVYLAGSGADRKIFYNHQTVADDDDPCIGGGTTVGAGHLKPALEILDDTGRFRGLISVEASVYVRRHGGDVVSVFDYNDIIPV